MNFKNNIMGQQGFIMNYKKFKTTIIKKYKDYMITLVK